MSRLILGISAFQHDAAAVLLRDGSLVAIAREERFSGADRMPRFPVDAIRHCLDEGRVEAAQLDAVVFDGDPLAAFGRVVDKALAAGSAGRARFIEAGRRMLCGELRVERHVRNAIGSPGKAGRVLFAERQMAHAASAFYPSPFDSAAILLMDGAGAPASTCLGSGSGTALRLFSEIGYPHSLGLLYAAIANFCGFDAESGESRLMALAPYGQARFHGAMRRRLADVRDDGSYRLDTHYLSCPDAVAPGGERLAGLFGGAPRRPGSPITQREMDLAASIRQLTEEIVLNTAAHLRSLTCERNLVLAGGAAVNCVANDRLVGEKIFDRVWIEPAAVDANGALGAALLASHMPFGQPGSASCRRPDAEERKMNGAQPDIGAMLGVLFDDVLAPMSERMGAAGAEVFPLAPDVSELSYFERRRRSGTASAGFADASCLDAAEFEARLAAHWLALGKDELAAQVSRFGEVAAAAESLCGNL